MKPLFEYISKELRPHMGQVGHAAEIKDGDFKAVIKYFDEPSKQYGIDGGKISKLWIKDVKANEVVANYDRGWDIEIKSPVVKKFYEKILKQYN
jgi:hypothetical protein